MNKTDTRLFFPLVILLILGSIFSTPTMVSAQVALDSNGNVGIGEAPHNAHKLRVRCANDTHCTGPIRYGISATVSNATTHGYAVYGHSMSASGNYNYGVHGRAEGAGVFNAGVYGWAGAGDWAGYFVGDAHAAAMYHTSDERLKENIRSLDSSDILVKIRLLQPQVYRFKNAETLKQQNLPIVSSREGDHMGLLAQDVENMFPELVRDVATPLDYGEEPFHSEFATVKAINYTGLIPVLIAAMQEQQAQIETLEARIEALEHVIQAN